MFKRRYKFRQLEGSASWTPGTILTGEKAEKDVTVIGAALNDYAQASFSRDTNGLTLTATVTAADTVTVVIANCTGANLGLLAGTVYAKVTKR